MKFLERVDKISSWASVVASLSLLVMTLIVGFEVGSRYLFNSPTIWAWDINVQFMLLLLMLGMSETYRRDAHVRVDVLTNSLSPKTRTILEILFAPVFFLIAGCIAWTGWEYFYDSLSRLQTASTVFRAPLYPIKFTLPLGGALLLLQGLSKLVRDIASLAAGGPDGDKAGTADEKVSP
jgi:TRAP-type C4-dicarboxylate transport system permease small subunit